MRIEELEINGLFDQSFKISFNKDVTFLYGINGCGKTTILNIVHALISGKLLLLHKYEFDTLRLSAYNPVTEEHSDILVNRMDDCYYVKFGDSEGIVPYVKPLRESRVDDGYYSRYESESERESKAQTSAIEEKFENVTKRIKEAFSPIFLPISRKDTSFDRAFMFRPNIHRTHMDPTLEASVGRAVQLVKEFVSFVTHKERTILDELKETVLRKAITHNIDPSDLISVDQYLVQKDIDIVSAISDLKLPIDKDLDSLASRIKGLRTSFKVCENNDIEIKHPMKFASYVSAVAQLRRFYEIASAVRDANKSRTQIRLPLTQLQNVINKFLYDGFKEVFIDEASGLLYFRRINTEERKSISLLSSGEKQILIFFTYIILGMSYRRKDGIFMVDEPEISLHLEWQHKFVPSLLEVSPGIQHIFATHSPEIIGEMEDKCVEVRGSVHG